MSSAKYSNSPPFEMVSTPGTVKAGIRRSQTGRRSREISTFVYATMITVALVGLGLASYLGWASWTSTKIAGCGSGEIFDCGHVMKTKWSSAFGIPVGVPAAGIYLVILSSLAAWSFANGKRTREIAKTLVAGSSFVASAAAIWFISLQLFVVEHLCQYCLAAHACGLILVSLSIWNLSMSKMKIIAMSMFGLSAVGVLAAAQVTAEDPPTFQIEEYPETTLPLEDQNQGEESNSLFSAPGFESPSKSKSSGDGVFEAPIAKENTKRPFSLFPNQNQLGLAVAGLIRPTSMAMTVVAENPPQEDEDEERLVQISNGRIKLNVAHWPLAGDADAEKIFIEMFDYTCPHCRENFKTISKVKEQMGEGKIATLVLCIPMNSNCNGTVRVNHDKHREACELAKLSVAVWRVDAEKFQLFHAWMFTGENPPTAAAAMEKAKELVDAEKLAAELEGKVVQQYIAKQVELYQNVGAGTVPKMLFSGTTVAGKVTSPDTLIQIINQQN